MGRLRRSLGGFGTAMLAGGLFAVFVGRMGPETGRAHVPLLLVFGAVYGLAVLGLMRLFGTRKGGHAVAGLLAGPLPAALLLGAAEGQEERGGLLLAGALLGLLIGLLEWVRPRAEEDASS